MCTATVAGLITGSIGLLLLKANRNEGTGELSDVDVVQRLNTRGGTPGVRALPRLHR